MKHTVSFVKSISALDQAPPGGLPEICVSGRSNVGKSSLINRLFGMKRLAKISQTPGKTQTLNYFLVDNRFYLVDLPGYGYAKTAKTTREQFGRLVEEYLNNRRELAGLMQLIDARHGPVAGDRGMLEWIADWPGHTYYIFTKADKLSANEQFTFNQRYAKEYGVENMTLFSARTGAGLDNVWSWIQRTLS